MTSASDAVQLQLLGTPLWTTAHSAANALPRKDAALLAMLALQGSTPRSRVTALLWPDNTEAGARNNLRQRIHRLNHAAGHDVIEHAETLRIAGAVVHDLQAPREALRADARAVQGVLLGSCDYGTDGALAAWVVQARQRWCAGVRDMVLEIALDLERHDAVAEALPYALRLVAEDPASESAAQLAMRLHIAAGDRDAALAAFERCVQALRARSGAAPSDDTLALARLAGGSRAAVFLPPSALALALRRPPRTVGRDDVLAAAEQAWTTGGVVLLTGAAGIGKTRVLDELAQRFGVGIRLHGAPGDSDDAQGLVGRLCAALLPHAGADLPADDARWLRWIAGEPGHERPSGSILPGRLALLLRGALDAAARRGVASIAIDDLHFADAPSLAALCAVLPDAPTGVRWLLATRDAPLPQALQRWLDGSDRRVAALLPVAPLPPRSIAELVGAIAGAGAVDGDAWAERLEAHCGGHPLFVLQLLRELAREHARLPALPPERLPVPAETLALVARRLQRADVAMQKLAAIAALCGVDFSAALAARLMDCSTADLLLPWQRLEDAHILDGDGFSHELIRRAVLDAVPAGVAALLHRDIAAALRDDAAASGRRAMHWQAGAAHAEAARDFAAAADEALSRGLHARACDWLRSAARNHRLAGAAGDAAHCDWRAGHLLRSSSSAGDAAALACELLAGAATLPERARALELLSSAKCERHDATAVDEADAAHAIATAHGDPALLALTRLAQANAWALLGRHDDALAALQEVQSQTAHLDLHAAVQCDELHRLVLGMLGRRREALDIGRRTLAAAQQHGDLSAVAQAAGSIAIQLAYLGDTEGSTRMAEQAIEASHRAGTERGFVVNDEMMLAGNHSDAGRYSDALALSERIVADLHDGGYAGWAIQAENDHAGIYMRLGRFDLAQRLLQDAPDDAPTWSRAARRLVQARLIQWRGGLPLPAVQDARRLWDSGGATLNPYFRERIELEEARWTSHAVAARRAAVAMRWARRHEHVAFGWIASMVRVEALTGLGRHLQAAREAAALQAQFGDGWRAFGFHLPELLLVLCDAFAAAGDAARAAAIAAQGQAWIRGCLDTQVPAMHRESFLERNPFNRRLLSWRT